MDFARDLIAGFVNLLIAAGSIMLVGLASLIMIRALTRAVPVLIRLGIVIGRQAGEVLAVGVQFLIAQANFLIAAVAIAATVAASLSGAVNVYAAYHADLPATIPASCLLLAVLTASLRARTLGAMLASGGAAMIAGAILSVVDYMARAIALDAVLMLLVFESQRRRSDIPNVEDTIMKKSNVAMTVMKVGLVIYTMARSIDLVQSTLPDEGNMKLLGLFVVFGLDIALLIWDSYTADPNKARSDAQHTIGAIMIGLNLLGIGATLIADSARIVDPEGMRELVYNVSIFMVPAVIIVNIIGMIAVNQLDPDREEAQREAEHKRKLAAMEAQHNRAVTLANRETDLQVAQLQNDRRIKRIKDQYYSDDNGNGRRDPGEPSAGSLAELAALLSRVESGGIRVFGTDGHDHGVGHDPKL